MPAQVVTGKNKRIAGERLQLSKGFQREDIRSVGLSFEPNFFVLWFYADAFGAQLIGSQICSYQADFPDEAPQVPAIFAYAHTVAFTAIPAAFFDEGNAQNYLEFNANPGQDKGNTLWDYLPEEALYLIHHDTHQAQQILDQHFPGLQLKHAMWHYLQVGLRIKEHEPNCAMLVLVEGLCHVLIYKNGDLKLCNALTYEHEEDVLYYFLFSANQLQLDSKAALFVLGGPSGVHATLKSYYSNVREAIPPAATGLQQGISDKSIAGNADFVIPSTAALCVS